MSHSLKEAIVEKVKAIAKSTKEANSATALMEDLKKKRQLADAEGLVVWQKLAALSDRAKDLQDSVRVKQTYRMTLIKEQETELEKMMTSNDLNVDSNRKVYQDITEKVEEQEKDHEQKKSELAELTTKLDDFKKYIANQEAHIDGLRKIEKLESSLAEAKGNQLKHIQAKNDISAQQLEKRKTKIADTRQQIKDARQKLKEYNKINNSRKPLLDTHLQKRELAKKNKELVGRHNKIIKERVVTMEASLARVVLGEKSIYLLDSIEKDVEKKKKRAEDLKEQLKARGR